MPSVLARIGDSLRAAGLLPALRPHPMTLRDPNLAQFLSGTAYSTTDTGVTVTESTALRYPAVWAAVQCIAGDVASLPFFHYRRQPNGAKERYSTSRLYRVLHDEFNPDMSAMVGRETMTAHVLLWGNAYAEIVRNDLGQVVALYPIEPTRVMPEWANGRLRYRVSTDEGQQVLVGAERILHLVGLGFDGIMGYSVIGMQRDALSVGMSAERLGGQVMARGAKYSGFFEHPRTLGATAHKHLKESIATDLPGTYRILEEGMTYKAGSMPLRDAQFMELRQFQVTEVARIFGIPPHKLGDLTHATFSNIEEQNIDYVIGTLRRWLVRWEQECNRKLVAPLEKTQQFCEHLVDGLLRGNIQSRYTAYSQGINNGFLSPNDIRGFENLDPIAGGDTYLVQGAMVPLDRLDDVIDAHTRPAPRPVIPAEVEPDDDADERMTRVVDKLVAELRARVGPSSPTMLTLIAGRLVRRELAQLKKRVADPTAAMSRLEKFYRRFVSEGVAELKPWMPEPVANRVLTAWADRAVQACVETLQRGTFAAMVQEWELDREATLRRMLQEAIDG